MKYSSIGALEFRRSGLGSGRRRWTRRKAAAKTQCAFSRGVAGGISSEKKGRLCARASLGLWGERRLRDYFGRPNRDPSFDRRGRYYCRSENSFVNTSRINCRAATSRGQSSANGSSSAERQFDAAAVRFCWRRRGALSIISFIRWSEDVCSVKKEREAFSGPGPSPVTTYEFSDPAGALTRFSRSYANLSLKVSSLLLIISSAPTHTPTQLQ